MSDNIKISDNGNLNALGVNIKISDIVLINNDSY